MSLDVINRTLEVKQSTQLGPSPSTTLFPTSSSISLLKIAKLSLGLLGLAAGSSVESTSELNPSIVFCSRDKIRPQNTDVLSYHLFSGDRFVKPTHKVPTFESPDKLCSITELGLQLIAGGGAGCYIETEKNNSGISGKFLHPKQCKQLVDQVKSELQERPGRPMRNSCPHGSRYHTEKGDVSLYRNKARMAACISTWGYIQELFLNKHLSTAEIKTLLLEIHSRIYHGDAEVGKFRDKLTHIELGPFAKQLKNKGSSDEDLEVLQSIYDLVDLSNASIDEMILNFSEKQMALLSRVAIIPPSPVELRKDLTVFARKLSDRLGDLLSHEADAITLAAWAHQQILRMHPFMDGNGRVARVMLNTILQMGGYEPVAIPNERDFYESMKSPKEFRDYLAQVVIWNQSQKKS
jgi:hypothetical protein